MQIHSIAVIGLGYVGLPLAVEFARQYAVVGFDIDEKRIRELKQGIDNTGEIGNDDLEAVMLRATNLQQRGLGG